MTIFPSPNLGRSAFFKGVFKHVAVRKDVEQVNSVTRWVPDFRVSNDGLKWRKGRLKGDILDALSFSGTGVFTPTKILPFKGRLVMVGRMATASPSYQVRASVFVRSSSGEWMRQTLSNDLINPTNSGIVDAVATADYLLALGANGVLHYWNGVDAWQSRTDLPMGVATSTNNHSSGITATSGGAIAVVGLYTNSDGSAGAPRLVSATSISGSFVSRSLPSMETLGIAARGNVLAAAAFASPNGLQRIIAASLSDVTSWSAAGLAVTGALEYLAYNGAKWITGGGYDKHHFISTSGSSGWSAVSDQASTPWGTVSDERPVVNSLIVADGKFMAHWGHYSVGSGGVSISADGETWQRILSQDAGLGNAPYLLGSFLA